MAPERHSPTDPREWLNRARSSLAKAHVRADDIYLEDLCFDAQQAAEKAIKAVLVRRGVPFPYVHDLGRLLDLAEGTGPEAPSQVRESIRLTRFAVADRYPGVSEPVTEGEFTELLSVAEAVIDWAGREIGFPARSQRNAKDSPRWISRLSKLASTLWRRKRGGAY